MNATLAPPASERSAPPRTLTGHSPPRGVRRPVRGIRAMGAAPLAVLLVVALGLRLWGIRQGLPYSYNVDEASHFVPRAIAFFSHGLDPRYFLNPPAYSYLLHAVLELWYGSGDAAARAFARDPSAVFVLARVVAAACGTLAVWLTYVAAARLFTRAVALLAAAISALAFLPVFYSHLALNDVPTLAPVALALVGVGGILRSGRGRDYALAGAGVGLAAATKYTGGYTLLCLIAAFATDATGGLWRLAARNLALALGCALICFLLANPYALLAPGEFFGGLSMQASLADGADPFKLGSSSGSGILYYLWTLTWGLGWGPALGALGGAVLLVWRRRLAPALVLIPAPLFFIAFMGSQQRFFGRWLIPTFPVLAILAAYAGVELARLLHRRLSLPPAASAALVAALLLLQSLAVDIHEDRVLSRPDTRNLARAWMVAHVPAGAKVVIEPVVPDAWAADVGISLPWTGTGERWWRYPTWMSSVDTGTGQPLPAGQQRYVPVDQYERTLRPALLDAYVQQGYCWVVVGSLQAGRAFADPAAAPRAIAYYRALAARARLAYHVSPFARGAAGVPFSFDWSIDYLPRQYRLPGPEMSVYRLRGGRCG